MLSSCHANNAFDGYLHSMRSAVEGNADNTIFSKKIDDDEVMMRIRGWIPTLRFMLKKSKRNRRKWLASVLQSFPSTTRPVAAVAVEINSEYR